jgi:16S rRNA (cytosine967-C5)-methyltransferase
MTPAARVQAVIDLVGEVERSIGEQGRPADRLVRDYFKSRRYAGSKDRAQVTERLFAILRRRAEWLWRLGADNGVPPRLMVAAALVCGENCQLSELAPLFDGSPYGPPVLSSTETDVLARVTGKSLEGAPGWVVVGYPEWLQPHLENRFGGDLADEMKALNQRAPLDLRTNTLKAMRDAALAALAAEGVSAEPTPLSPLGIRAHGRARVTGLTVFQGGQIEVQDEGSQVAALLADARPGAQVVDMCAGGGGKTLALAAAMENRGQIYAADTDPRRLKQLDTRLTRAGARNVQSGQIDGAGASFPGEGNILSGLNGRADRVLIDAPCSGTGAWRRNPDAKWRLTPGMLARHVERQDRLLSRAALLVKPGGRLIYVTCSVLRDENEYRVAAFLAGNPEFRSIPVAEVWREALGTQCPSNAVSGDFLFLTPQRHGTDGFFVAVLVEKSDINAP